MGWFPSIGIVHWYNYRFSDLGFHLFCIGEQKAEAFCEAVNCEQSEQEGKFLFCDVDGFHYEKRGELWYHSIIHYNVNHFKGSYGRPESHISSILDYQFCACVMRTSAYGCIL